jgi:flagellar motor switch protein FliN/FliY
MSAVGEAMNQMMGAVATSLSTMFNKKIDISPPKVNLIDRATQDKVTEIFANDDPIVRVSFRMEVDGLIDSEIMQLLPIHVATEMVDSMMSGMSEKDEAAPVPEKPSISSAAMPAAAPSAAPSPAAQAVPATPQASAPVPPRPIAVPQAAPVYGTSHVAANVPVQPAQFAPLSTEPVQVNDANIGLILDVPLSVTVELGSTKKSIKDILELTNGSIVELDKLAGEAVDINVNGKLLAKGEVVVIDENFGVRITDIVSPQERAARLQ